MSIYFKRAFKAGNALSIHKMSQYKGSAGPIKRIPGR